MCTHERRPRFTSVGVVNAVLLRFQQCSAQEGVAIFAYCFMPDHVHFLLAGRRADADVGRFVARSKQSAGYWFSQTFRARLWQRYSWDRVLREEEETLSVIRYLLANPVRAGIVSHPLHYPFSGSDVFTREQLLDAFASRAG
jgi:putative transposase